ncbi:MAG: extracellular solute-binding protein [Clostridia bacterium]|nr:extracellular solute-binding protein [Clostridia bacterium]
MRFKRIIAFVLSVSTAAVFASCGFVPQKEKETASGETPTIEIWRASGVAPAGYEDPMNKPGFKKLTEIMENEIGVKLKYITPTAGGEQQQFNLMLASRELPDIVTFWWNNVPGGPQKAIKDGYVYAMDDAFLKKNAPNFYKLVKDNEVYEKGCKTDSGDYYIFPQFYDYEGEKAINLYTNGYIMRSDWLRELGLEVPETIDEWYIVLKAFKEKKGASAPFTGTSLSRGFGNAFGIHKGFYHDGDTVKYGEYEDGYRDYLTTLNKWYEEGLLDSDIANIDSKMANAKMLNGQSGVMWGWLGSGFGRLVSAATEEGYALTGVPAPVKNKGDKPEYNEVANPVYGSGSIINPASKHIELAARVLDFGYSDEGHMLANFGVEGESYEMVDGYPKYTDKVMKNEEGLSFTDALGIHTAKVAGSGAFREDYRYIQQNYSLPEQQKAQQIWMKGNGAEHIMPTISYTEEENKEFSKISSEVSSYITEMQMKFITGVEPLSKFDSFRAELKKLGIERMIKLTQDAYDRYIQR